MDTLKFKIKDKFWETPEACSFVLENVAGNTLFYKPGQFITLIVNLDGKEYKRSYSLSSVAVKDKNPAITIKKIKGGNISSYLIERLNIGDYLDAHYPAGMFVPDLHPANARQYFLFAAGSGITPLFAMMKSILVKEPKSFVNLVFSSRDEDHIIYNKQIIKLEFEFPERLNVTHLLSNPSEAWQGFKGRADHELLENLISELSLDIEKSFFICGPKDYMEIAEAAIKSLGFASENIKKESFKSEIISNSKMNEASSKKSVKIVYRKEVFEYELEDNQTILDGALDHNYRIPYNCASGVCTACLGKCVEGEVDMGDSDALSENEKKMGLVLTCIGKPITEKVVIQID
ncbi:MAG: ferredoxin--NADP reductase [Opitutaceae bacterium]|nr:ferredoxin--NADP reductase [Cytophagales bacterium]